MPKLIDLTGQTFGRWKVLKKAPSAGKKAYWTCQCQCGTIRDVAAQSLRDGRSTSCGCYHNEQAKKQLLQINKSMIRDLTGQRFGKLQVIEQLEERAPNGSVMWLCKCDCGNYKKASSANLVKYKTLHCGCLNQLSKGEMFINTILKENNISFDNQHCFPNCKYPETNTAARFDFWVQDKYIIEYDGETHFPENVGMGWITQEKYNYTKQHDDYKNQWCKDNNIPLIRIPYTHFKDLCIEDLLLETTHFLV